jgi:hypothetical protein
MRGMRGVECMQFMSVKHFGIWNFTFPLQNWFINVAGGGGGVTTDHVCQCLYYFKELQGKQNMSDQISLVP